MAGSILGLHEMLVSKMVASLLVVPPPDIPAILRAFSSPKWEFPTIRGT